jgi:NAD(P)-dependent dehydrogenase (short-subunit alcohol dehydrogenase family)
MKYEIPAMLARGGGAIVNTSSSAGLAGTPGLPAYAASKHGVIGLTRTAAIEHAAQKIRVNAICPSATRTPMFDRLLGSGLLTEQQIASSKPIGRIATVEEVAETAAWLCSERASFVLGQALAVDGGESAQ